MYVLVSCLVVPYLAESREFCMFYICFAGTSEAFAPFTILSFHLVQCSPHNSNSLNMKSGYFESIIISLPLYNTLFRCRIKHFLFKEVL